MLRRIKKYFFSGLAVFLPLALTIYVCVWVLNFAESIFGSYLRPFFLENYAFYFWGLGIFTLLLIILLCGFLITNYFGRSMHRMAEQMILKIPVVANIYPAFKEIAGFLFREDDGRVRRPQQVVLVEWPRKGCYCIAFLTNTAPEEVCTVAGREMLSVLVPTVPNPITGFVVMIPKDEIIVLKMTVEEAIKIIVSGGVVTPGRGHEEKPPAN